MTYHIMAYHVETQHCCVFFIIVEIYSSGRRYIRNRESRTKRSEVALSGRETKQWTIYLQPGEPNETKWSGTLGIKKDGDNPRLYVWINIF